MTERRQDLINIEWNIKLATMTSENQSIHGELCKFLDERDQLGKKTEGYAQHLENLEEWLTMKIKIVVLQ